MATITAARLRELLHYDPLTGIFTYLPRGRGVMPGKQAGGLHKKSGYITIGIEGATFKAHRLAVLYMTGSMPPVHVDHENRNRSDNRYLNLRPATRSQNCANRLPAFAPASGHKGVYWAPHAKCWRAEITRMVNGKRRKRILGYFHDPDLAGEFRELAGWMVWGAYYLAPKSLRESL
jgi:hypothetical protein